MHNPSPIDDAAAQIANTANAVDAIHASPTSAAPHIELLPPSLVLRIGKRRLTLSRRPRKSVSLLLSGLLSRSWRTLFGSRLRISLAAAAVCAAWNTVAMAAAPAANTLPTGGTITSGSATLTQTANTLTINQTSNQAIGNFTSFSIGSGASVIINEPTSASSFLARVTGTNPSLIYGLLQSNGGVMLVNQNGILVGQGGVVDVARFVASTINISDSDFLAGKLNFSNTAGTSGAVENQGLIQSASGGSVYLIGSNVSNSGIIHSPNGEVILAAGASVQLVDTGTPGVTVNITGAAGNVTNLGNITAEAGTIGIAAGLINNSGTVNASSVVADGGRIFLRASSSLTTTSTSTIAADGATDGGSVVLYSAGSAFIDGAVSATGGTGSGGYVETSGLTSLDVVTAPTIGAGGTWYIDPYDLTVVSGDSSVDNIISTCGTYAVTSNGSSSTIGASCISAWLSNGLSVTLATGSDGSTLGGNITVNAAITKSAGASATLTLNADENININANITSTSGLLNLNLNTDVDRNYGSAQSVQVSNATIALNGGTLNVSDGISGIRQGNLLLTSGSLLNLNATSGGSVYVGNLSVDSSSNVVGASEGSTVVVSDTLTNNGTISLANTVEFNVGTFNNNGVLTLNNTSTSVFGNVGNTGTLLLSNMTFNVTNAIDNTGTVNISNSSIYAVGGFTNEVGGTVNANYLSYFGLGSVRNAGIMTLDSTAAHPTGFEGDTSITLSSGISNTGTLTVLGTVTNNGNISNAGNMTVGSASIATTVSGGGWSNSGNLTLANGSYLSSQSGELDNDGNLVMNNATMAFKSIVNNEDGTISGTGTIDVGSSYFFNSGTIAPGGVGTVGTLTVAGNFQQYSDGTILLDFASASNYDQLNVSDWVYLDGTLQTTLLGSYVPTLGASFQPFGTSSEVSGYFRTVQGTVVNASGSLEMLKASTTDSGIFVNMSGSETFKALSGNWDDLSIWVVGTDSAAYLPTAIDNVIVSCGTLYHSDGTDVVNNLTVNTGMTLAVTGGSLSVSNMTSTGNVSVGEVEASAASVTLAILNAATLTNISLGRAGQVTGASGSTLNVTGNFTDNGGIINSSGNVILAQTDGSDLTVGNITAQNLVLQSTGGAILQSDALHVTHELVTASLNSTTLDNANNQIAAYSGINTGSGDIVLVNNLNTTDTTAVAINGITNTVGNISVDNTGAMQTTALTSTGSAAVDAQIASLGVNTSGVVSAVVGNVTLATHSPLTVGSAGISAAGDVTLSAGDGTVLSDVLSVNGNITSTNGLISLVSNQTVYSAGVTLSDLNGTTTPVPFVASTVTSNSVDTSVITSQVSNVVSSVNSAQNTSGNTSSNTSSSTGSTNSSTSTTFTTSDGQVMTTGGESGTFGSDDSGDGNKGSSSTKSTKTIKLYCS